MYSDITEDWKDNTRTLVWFSCGAASAVAAKLASEEHKNDNLEVLYCDLLKNEHPDNLRFLNEVQEWIGHPIKLLKSEVYDDIYDVFKKTGWLVGSTGARCTTELKKNVRKAYQKPEDTHIFGLTADEGKRIDRFCQENSDLWLEWNIRDKGITKKDCYKIIKDAGIELPAMYRLGYTNNNCIGCVKGGIGYWNKIRRDFPDVFAKMAKTEREMGVTILRDRRGGTTKRVYLDELDPNQGRYESEPDMDCGPQCVVPKLNL